MSDADIARGLDYAEPCATDIMHEAFVLELPRVMYSDDKLARRQAVQLS